MEESIKKKNKIKLFLKKTAKTIDPVIKELLGSYINKRTKKILNYQILTGGKRIRPALSILSCQLVGGKIKDVLCPAAGLEILHNYSLIIDDIIDHSELRRERPTCWVKFGKSIAQCLGTDYSATAFQAANQSKNPILISEIFAKTVKTGVDGEILDILFEQKGREDEPYIVKNRYLKITDKDYLKMASRKTASLFQTCCEVGGICAGAKPKEIRALRNYGLNLGIAFQIRDDILDIFGKRKSFGKKIGKDIIERKLGNIIILYTLKKLSQSQKEKFLKIMRKRRITNRDIKEAMELIKKTQSYQKAYLLGKKYILKVKQSLKALPQNKWNDILRDIADFVMEREH